MRRLSIWMGTATAVALLLGPLSNSYAADSAASSPQSASSVAASCPGAAEASAAMQRMRSMHEQMAAAKTPAQRRAIMAAYMNTMHEGMSMMQHMGSAACGGSSTQMMQMRMDMMTMMMQMMMDRQQTMGMGMGARARRNAQSGPPAGAN